MGLVPDRSTPRKPGVLPRGDPTRPPMAKGGNNPGGPALPKGGYSPSTIILMPRIKELSEEGLSITKIAKELKISQDTVRRVLNEDSKEGVSHALHAINRYLPRIADMVCRRILAKEDVPHGLEVLEKAGVFPRVDAPPAQFNDNRLQLAIQNLIPTVHNSMQDPPKIVLEALPENAPDTP